MNPQTTVPGTPEQQVIDRLKTAVNVLVTVSTNPSVDQLAAAIGFTLLLNKLGKHATAVFSGNVPSTIEFLKPEATIEKNTDSLRDFIVSLDKSKADKLRYKVEENVVKIFITPYRTSLSEKDLEFSQGDFNVDVVVALGVKVREELDQAIVAHGRILHDAAVITVSAGQSMSDIGVINWQDNGASSLCEMLVGVSDMLQPGLMDNQIATAFLTGVVAETERFRNDKTTPKVMTMSAQLMAAGANQQLIASKLENELEVQTPVTMTPSAPAEAQPADNSNDGALNIEHDSLPEPVVTEAEKPHDNQIQIDEQGNLMLPGADLPPVAEVKSDTTEPEVSTADEAPSEKPRRLVVKPLSTKTDLLEGRSSPAPADQAGITEDGLNEDFVNPLAPPPVLPPAPGTDAPAPDDSAPAVPEAAAPPPPPVVDVDLDSQPPVTVASSNPNPEPVPVTPAAEPDPSTVATLPPALDDNTLRDIEKTFDSEHIAADPSSTLTEIETVEHSPHLTVDSARDAVQTAQNATPYDPNRPAPLQALNAKHVYLSPQGTNPSDPVLAGLGLSDSVTPPTDNQPPTNSYLTSPPPATEPAAEEGSEPEAPPVPPPFISL